MAAPIGSREAAVRAKIQQLDEIARDIALARLALVREAVSLAQARGAELDDTLDLEELRRAVADSSRTNLDQIIDTGAWWPEVPLWAYHAGRATLACWELQIRGTFGQEITSDHPRMNHLLAIAQWYAHGPWRPAVDRTKWTS